MFFYLNQKAFFSKKILLNKFIFLLLFDKFISQFSLIQHYSSKNYPKVLTMSNGYILIISTMGIYSLYPNLSIAYSYLFNKELFPSISLEEAKFFIGNADIQQFWGKMMKIKRIIY